MQIAVNAGEKFWEVYNERARSRLEALGADTGRVPRDHNPTEEEAAALIAGADVVMGTWGTAPFSAAVLSAAPDLKLVIYGAGSVKGFVTPELVERGVTVLSAAHINAIPVAEFVLGVILVSLKGVLKLSAKLRSDGPRAWKRDEHVAPGYYGTTVGLLGLGKVSRHLLRLLGNFDFNVLVEDPYLTMEEADRLGVRKSTLEEVMAESDVISLHHANVPINWGMINGEALARMKPGATLINTSRGRLVDEDALVDALQTRDITAYLDVTHPEPPEANHAFYTLPNCILTPHVAGSYAAEVERMGAWAVEQLDRALAGESLDGVVDLSRLDSIA